MLALLVVGIPVVLFVAGEDLFGSDSETIDSYNRETLESCAIPDDSTLVQVSTRPMFDDSGQSYRSMWYVYASPLPADDVAEIFGVEVDRSMLVSSQQACRFGQRPSALVQTVATAGEPTVIESPAEGDPVPDHHGLWADQAAEVTFTEAVPAGTQSLFRLRLAQPDVDGIF